MSGKKGMLKVLRLSVVLAGVAQSVLADGATRDLPDFYGPGLPLTVSIAIDAPVGSIVVLLADATPAGWTAIANISDGGEYDEENHKVKWDPFFTDLSRTVTYEVTPPEGAAGEQCFAGDVSFDGNPTQPTEGDQCIAVVVPTLSGWGLLVMALLILTAGTIAIRRQPRPMMISASSLAVHPAR